MSSLSNFPYGKILDYWYEKLSNKPYRIKFLLTKIVEVFTFKSHSGKNSNKYNYIEFPKPIKNNIPENPKLSIVIPTFLKFDKDKHDISNLLQSIKKQKSKPTEVIVIDDFSPIKFSFPSNITVHRLEKNSGPAKARNTGKKIAIENGSDIIAFTDTDCILSENWVEIIKLSFIEFKNFQILSGNTAANDNGWFGTYHNINGTLNGRKLKGRESLLYGTTANMAITKDAAMNIDFNKKFSIAAGEDIEFCFKANRLGFAIKYIPGMVVYHNFGYNGQFYRDIKQFRRQFKKYGQGEKILLNEVPSYYTYFNRTKEIPSKEV